jgi:16S rRNA C967 or C1407 C5-methylase (RsmB/RsmF family)
MSDVLADRARSSREASALFTNYYKRLLALHEDSQSESCSDREWFEFIDACNCPLPLTFRCNAPCQRVNAAIASRFNQLASCADPAVAPQRIVWTDSNCIAWRFPCSCAKVEQVAPEMHTLIQQGSLNGSLYRQEEVSMVPVQLLQPLPHHSVLDLCASPGSKTSQILNSSAFASVGGGGCGNQGVVVANDSNYDRCCLLAQHHHPALAVTHQDAQRWPLQLQLQSGRNVHFTFDRILCDVPCAGDGTMRKQPRTFLEKWNGVDSLELHTLQLSILLRGMQLLQRGGRLVYSTCSMNPIENEAVVAEALRIAGAALSISLLPTHDMLPEFKRRQGLVSWPVLDSAGVMHTKLPFHREELSSHVLVASMFAPANARQLHLQRCMRVYPHLQNSGGFFVAVFHKLESAPALSASSFLHAPAFTQLPNGNCAPAAEGKSKKSKKAAKKHFRVEDAWCAVPQEVWAPIVKSFGLNDGELKLGQLFMRQADLGAASVKKIHCSSVGCSALLRRGCSTIHAEGVIHVDTIGDFMRRLRILSCGLRLFERIGGSDAPHLLCPCPPALIALKSSLFDATGASRRFIWLSAESWRTLLREKRLHIDSMSHADEKKVLQKLYKYATLCECCPVVKFIRSNAGFVLTVVMQSCAVQIVRMPWLLYARGRVA